VGTVPPSGPAAGHRIQHIRHGPRRAGYGNIPPAAVAPSAPPAAGTDLAALRRVLAATADPAAARTVRAMPNAAPPRPAALRRAAAPPPSTPAASVRTAATPAAAAPAGLPASFAGIGALLAGAGERVPTDALTLATLTATERTAADVDVSGIWTLDAAMAPACSNTCCARWTARAG